MGSGLRNEAAPPIKTSGSWCVRSVAQTGTRASRSMRAMLRKSVSKEIEKATRSKSRTGVCDSSDSRGVPARSYSRTSASSGKKTRSHDTSGMRLKSSYTDWKPRFAIPTPYTFG